MQFAKPNNQMQQKAVKVFLSDKGLHSRFLWPNQPINIRSQRWPNQPTTVKTMAEAATCIRRSSNGNALPGRKQTRSHQDADHDFSNQWHRNSVTKHCRQLPSTKPDSRQGLEVNRRELWALSRMTFLKFGHKTFWSGVKAVRMISPLTNSSAALSTVNVVILSRTWRNKPVFKNCFCLSLWAPTHRLQKRFAIFSVALVKFWAPVPASRSWPSVPDHISRSSVTTLYRIRIRPLRSSRKIPISAAWAKRFWSMDFIASARQNTIETFFCPFNGSPFLAPSQTSLKAAWSGEVPGATVVEVEPAAAETAANRYLRTASWWPLDLACFSKLIFCKPCSVTTEYWARPPAHPAEQQALQPIPQGSSCSSSHDPKTALLGSSRNICFHLEPSFLHFATAGSTDTTQTSKKAETA